MNLPVATSGTVLLGFLGIRIDRTILCEEAGEMILGVDGAIGKTSVVLVVELVRAGHFFMDFR